MFRIKLSCDGDVYTSTVWMPTWMAHHARRIYHNGRRRGASPMIARYAVGKFYADHICGNVPWQVWL